MGSFAVGDVVLVIFPFADLSGFKRRPALIVGLAEFGNYITCQITSKSNTSKQAIPITDKGFSEGGLKVESFIRPDKIFTLEPSLIKAKAGTLTTQNLEKARAAIRDILT